MTTTLKLNSAEITALRRTLNDEGFEFKRLAYAHFQARVTGLVISAYESGKVVVQGARAAEFLKAHGYAKDEPGLDGRTVGSDESGKGDYFGPLVVAAVAAGPEDVAGLRDAGVRDGKKMTDASILRAAAAVRKLCRHSVRTLTPVEYNARHKAEGNVALFLSTMHAEAIAGACDDACTHVVIDQFTFADRLKDALKKQGVELPVEIRPRAEDNPAVAAASVLARAEFLIGLRELGSEHGWELPKGASAKVESVAREIFRAGGIEALSAVAKTHFKTTLRVTEQLF